ncbi:MAG TPA: sugar ABC transporter substrate-binding protein [Caldilineaceae bacterium]|nr:sugar ABC transporter substrate-binding protein [Caldilineaceae bacterium]
MHTHLGRLTRRQFLQAAAAASAPLVLAACAPTTAPAPSGGDQAAAPSGEKVTVRYIAMDYDSRMQPDTQELFDEFNASQGEIEAILEVVSWPEGRNVLLTQISGGQAPDIFNGSGQWLLEFQSVGELAALDDLLPAELLDTFWESGIQAMTVQGTLYGLPYFLDPRGLYYRTDLFEEAGLDAPVTWADIREAAQALHNPPDVYGIGLGPGDYWWYAWVGAIGGGNNLSRWKEDGRSRVGDPEGVRAVQFLADLVLTDQVSQPSPASANRDADLQPLFLGGQLAILETGSWMPTIIANDAPDLPFAVAPLPVAEEGMAHANVFWPDCVMMAEQSQKKEQAATLLEFMFNFENRLKWALQRGVIPERVDVGQDPRYLDPNSPITPFNEFFVKELATAHNVFETPWPASGSEDDTTINDGLVKVWLGEATPEEAMTEAARLIDERHGLA